MIARRRECERMKRKTKTKRLQQIIDEYHRRNPGTFTMGDVVDWAISVTLMPDVPGRTKAEDLAAGIWDSLFDTISSESLR